jgi:hypothetical protein
VYACLGADLKLHGGQFLICDWRKERRPQAYRSTRAASQVIVEEDDLFRAWANGLRETGRNSLNKNNSPFFIEGSGR